MIDDTKPEAKPLAAWEFAEQVVAHWPPTSRWTEQQEEQWTNSLVYQVKPFTDEARGEALQNMIRTRREEKIPSVATCVDACVAAKRWLEAEAQGRLLPGFHGTNRADNDRHAAYTDDRRKTVDDLMRNPIARQAAREGWHNMLEKYALQHGCFPEDKLTLDRLKTAAKDVENWHPVGAAAIAAKAIIMGERDRAGKRILGGK